MADSILQNGIVFIEEEVTEGLYVTPSAGASAIGVLEEGANEVIVPAKEALERTILNASLDKPASRTGMKSVSGTLPIELKAGAAQAIPEAGVLYKSALGSYNAATADLATTTDHSTTLIKMASTAGLAVGDIVAIKNSDGNIIHVSPISALVANTSITLLVADSEAFADTVTVRKMLDYTAVNSGHKSFSLTAFTTGTEVSYIEEQAHGCKVTSLSLENFASGQMPTVSFSYEGMDFVRSVAAPAHVPSYDASMPVIALNAGLYLDGDSFCADEFSLSVENGQGFRNTVCLPGRGAARTTSREITGTINPYKQDDAVTNYTKWLNNTTHSLFYVVYNPDANGFMTEVVACYLPSVQFTEIAQSDKDGLLQDSLSFKARAHATLSTLKMAFN